MNSPIVVNARLTKGDLCWNFLYGSYRGFVWRPLIILVFILPPLVFFGHDLPFSSLTRMFFIVFFGFGVFTYIADIALYLFNILVIHREYMKTVLRSVATIKFMPDHFMIESEDGQGTIKYQALKNVFIYKNHIVLSLPSGGSYLVPCRDIPVDCKNDLLVLLKEAQEKMKKK